MIATKWTCLSEKLTKSTLFFQPARRRLSRLADDHVADAASVGRGVRFSLPSRPTSGTLARENRFKPVEVLFVGGFANRAHPLSDLGVVKLLDPGQACFVSKIR